MSLARHWFQYHEITLPPVKEEDGKVIRNKKGIKKKEKKKRRRKKKKRTKDLLCNLDMG